MAAVTRRAGVGQALLSRLIVERGISGRTGVRSREAVPGHGAARASCGGVRAAARPTTAAHERRPSACPRQRARRAARRLAERGQERRRPALPPRPPRRRPASRKLRMPGSTSGGSWSPPSGPAAVVQARSTAARYTTLLGRFAKLADNTIVSPDIFLLLSAFLASAVEMVEALTIVLAGGVTRGWRSALVGVGAALLALAALVGLLGPSISRVPIDTLRVIVGALLLVFGLQWLRKAILRASGYKALHDEEAAYAEQREEASGAGDDRRAGLDWYSFTVTFKGCSSRASRSPSS